MAAESTGSKKREMKPEAVIAAEVRLPGDFAGVILWPEVRPVTTLVALLAPKGSALASPPHVQTIPFGGEYWIYRWPFRRPPENSSVQRGTPASLAFRTSDNAPLLQMEARQRLVQAISLRCCSALRVAILNADRYPGTVALELTLSDREQPNVKPLCLGVAPRYFGSGSYRGTDRSGSRDLGFPNPTIPTTRSVRRDQSNIQHGGQSHAQKRASGD